jgi:hypothetical protein
MNKDLGDNTMIADIQLYALWALAAIGAAGAFLAWWVM